MLYGIISSIWMRTRIKPVPEVSYAQTPATKLRCQKHHFKHSTEKKCKPPFSVGYVIKLMTGAGAEGPLCEFLTEIHLSFFMLG